jgi:hypothetical protein
MKLINIPRIFYFSCIFLLSFQICNSIRVGFFSSNTEGKLLNQEDQLKMLNSFIIYSQNFNKKMLLEKEISSFPTSFTNINSHYDVLLFSFQEANQSLNLDLLFSKLDSSVWECPGLITKDGKTKLFGSVVTTAVGVCLKKNELEVTVVKKATYKSYNIIEVGNTKSTLGLCLKRIGKISQYCFMGGHFDTSIDKAVEKTTMKMIKKIRKFMNSKSVTDYTIYVVGDMNVRLWFSINKDNIDTVLDYSMRGLVRDNHYNPHGQYDQNAIEYFENKVKQVSKTEFNEAFILKFCGNHNLRQLPFTYKLNEPKKDEDIKLKKSDSPINPQIYDIKQMLKTKTAHSTLEVNNYGWLDRLACIYSSSKIHECKIKGGIEAVKYSIVPSLRYGDHMPLIGFFTIDDNNKKKLK